MSPFLGSFLLVSKVHDNVGKVPDSCGKLSNGRRLATLLLCTRICRSDVGPL